MIDSTSQTSKEGNVALQAKKFLEHIRQVHKDVEQLQWAQ